MDLIPVSKHSCFFSGDYYTFFNTYTQKFIDAQYRDHFEGDFSKWNGKCSITKKWILVGYYYHYNKKGYYVTCKRIKDRFIKRTLSYMCKQIEEGAFFKEIIDYSELQAYNNNFYKIMCMRSKKIRKILARSK